MDQGIKFSIIIAVRELHTRTPVSNGGSDYGPTFIIE